MAVTQVEESASKKAGADLASKFRMAAREIYFPTCRDLGRELVINDEVFLVRSLSLEKGKFVFDDGEKHMNDIPERWIVMDIQNSGVLTLKSLETNQYKQTKPNDSVVKAMTLLNNDGDIRDAVLDKLNERAGEVTKAMKKALERITGLVTAFIEGSKVLGTDYPPLAQPRNATDYLMSIYIDVLAEVGKDEIEKRELRDRLLALKRGQLDLLLLDGKNKFGHLALPNLTDLLAGKTEKGSILVGDKIFIPNSPYQFVEIVDRKGDSFDIRLCELSFGLDGLVPSVVVIGNKPLLGITTAKLLKIYLNTAPEEEGPAPYLEWRNLETLKDMGHISKYSFNMALEMYNKSQRAAFERGELIQLVDSFRKAHRRVGK